MPQYLISLLGLGVHLTFVHPSGVEFLFLLVLWNTCDQITVAFIDSLGGPSSHCQTSRCEAQDFHFYASKSGKLSIGHRTGKGQFSSNPKERQCQRMLKLLNNCTHLTRE